MKRILLSVGLILVVSFSALMESGVKAVEEGLVLHFNFDKVEGSIVKDLSGNSNNGIIHGIPKWIESPFGKALQFDGTDNYIEVPDSETLRLQKEGAIGMWIKIDSFPEGFSLIGKPEGWSTPYAIWWHSGAKLLCCTVSPVTGKEHNVAHLSPPPPGRWSHLVFTWDGANLKTFIDGLGYRVEKQTLNVGINNYDLRIGGGGGGGFKGVIGEIKIYNRALSEKEIKEPYLQMWEKVQPKVSSKPIKELYLKISSYTGGKTFPFPLQFGPSIFSVNLFLNDTRIEFQGIADKDYLYQQEKSWITTARVMHAGGFVTYKFSLDKEEIRKVKIKMLLVAKQSPGRVELSMDKDFKHSVVIFTCDPAHDSADIECTITDLEGLYNGDVLDAMNGQKYKRSDKATEVEPIHQIEKNGETVIFASYYSRGETVSFIGGGVQGRWMEYDLSFPLGGRYTLAVEYAGVYERPINTYWDGKPISFALGKATGSWSLENSVLEDVATFNIAAGKHILKLQEFQTMPTIGNIKIIRTERLVSVPYIDEKILSLRKILEKRRNDLSSLKSISSQIEILEKEGKELSGEIEGWEEEDINSVYEKLEKWEKSLQDYGEQIIHLKASQIFGDKLEYIVGIEDSMTKVRKEMQNLLFHGDISPEIIISLARNEYEGKQLVILPKKDLEEVKITATDLINPQTGKKIEKENIEIHLVGYVETKQQPPYIVDYVGWWPDPLLDNQTFSVKKNEVQPVWITIYVPENIRAGKYEGTVNISCDNASVTTLRIIANIWDFSIPKEQNLIHSNIMWPYAINRFYEYGPEGLPGHELSEYKNIPLQVVKELCAFALKYRIGLMNVGWGFAQESTVWPIKETKEGYDYSNIDDIIQFCIDGGMNGISMADISKPFFLKEEYKKNLKMFITDYSSHLKEKGWFERFHLKLQDEPNLGELNMIKTAGALIKEIDPEIKRLCTTHLGYIKIDKGLNEAIDIWCCGVPNYNPELAHQLQAEGKQVWWYNGYPHPYPNYYIDNPAIDTRILFWNNWKYKIDGYLNWALNWWPPANNKKGTGKQWPKIPWDTNFPGILINGDGYVVYPSSKAGKPFSSIRLENMRDSAEDYEYFYLLQQKSKELAKINRDDYNRVVKETQTLLNISEDIIKNPSEHTSDPDKLYQYRERVAMKIERVNHLLSKGE